MMKYKDGRFAKDPRFRFFAMYCVMKWQAINSGSVFLQRNSAFRNATVGQMRDMLAANRALAREIMFLEEH